MKYVHFRKIPGSMLNDTSYMKVSVELNTEQLKKKYSKKSHVWKNFTIQLFNQNGDDFKNNIVTIKTEADLFKAPRLIKYTNYHLLWQDRLKKLKRILKHGHSNHYA